MPRRNRVSPFGNIEFSDAKGQFMGNRGVLINEAGEVRRLYAHKNWVCCTLVSRNGERIRFDTTDHYTPIFFWDEAVALSAGHRPCGQCRNADYKAFKRAFAIASGRIDETTLTSNRIDAMLHADRIEHKQKTTFHMRLSDLPAGCIFLTVDRPDAALLWHRGQAYPWRHDGYQPPVEIDPATVVTVLTPKLTVATIRAGYEPQLRLT